jgi:hypothetical protein
VRSDFLFDEPPDTPYQLTLERGEALPAATETEPNDDVTTAAPVADAFALVGDRVGSDDVFAWRLGETPVDEAVTLRAHGRAGADFTLTLATDEGAQLLYTYSDDAVAALPDLRLPAGRYQVTISRADAGPEPYVLSASFAPPGEGDAEPNDSFERALPVALGTLASGRLNRPADQDLYRLDIDEATAGLLLDAKLLGPDGPGRELCLSAIVDAAAGEVLRCTSGEGPLAIPALGLAAGPYLFAVRSSEVSDAPYYLRIDATAPPATDFEVEPNDRPPLATAMAADIEMRGRTTVGDDDYYRVTVDGEPQLWGIDVTGGALDRLEWVQADGVTLASGTISGDRALASISDMFLEPGAHWFRVAGNGGYTVRLTPLGAPDPADEREPNDDAAHAELLLVGGERTGRLPLAADTDTYRFSLAATEHVRLEVEPPADGAAAFRLTSGLTTFASRRAPATGEGLSYDAALPPGDYLLTLQPGVVSSEPYRISLAHLDPFVIAADQEPNDVTAMARPFPGTLVVDGSGTPEGDEDWYRLPPVAMGEVVTVRYTGAVGSITLSDGRADLPAVVDVEAGMLTSDPLASEAPVYLRLQASGDYRVELAAPGLSVSTPRVSWPCA